MTKPDAPFDLSRRAFSLTLAAGLMAPVARAEMALTANDFVADFDQMWRTLDAKYPFFADKATDWQAVRRLYRPLAWQADNADRLRQVLQRALTELYDAHTHIHDTPKGTPRFPPFDIYALPEAGGARVHQVLAHSDADQAGIRAGDLIAAINGVTMAEATKASSAQCLKHADPEQDLYALNAALSGKRGAERTVTVVRPAGPVEVKLAFRDQPQVADLSFRILDGNLGYIAITSFANDATIAKFDAALLALKATKGLIIDVRDNGGGDTAVARPIMGRFITDKRPYAHMRRRDGDHLGAAWIEYVEPRGPFTYAAPVVVLTDRWSASMAEGFPMGMKGIGRATVVGTPMMGLGAGVYDDVLKRTGINYQFSAEPVYDIGDQPRWRFAPDVAAADGEDILGLGVKTLTSMIAAG